MMKIIRTLRTFALPVLCSLALAAMAQNVNVQDDWARAKVPGQKANGAFMKITAGAEVHEMKMDGGVMSKRPLDGGLVLLAGKAVELKPLKPDPT